MLFNSIQFVVFFPIVLLLYFSLPHRYRWVLLLGASYFFYMAWEPAYIVLILFSTLLDYFAGRRISVSNTLTAKKGYLVMSLVGNLGLLFTFKYFNFFSENVQYLCRALHIPCAITGHNFLLPIGISFYTFQTLSYTIGVYRGTTKCEKHLGIFALYVAFFPQLVAGPIERANRLLKQFYQKVDFDPVRVTRGFQLILWGMFKKILIADRLALFVDTVYAQPTKYPGISLCVATVFFSFQIYCDFSAYSDIAIGSAQIMGIRLMDNFRRPYFSKSIAEFWKRWHISLSTWFRDYLYIPLGGSRVPQGRWVINIAVTFLVSGLWHGASWTFFLWGGLHAFYMLFAHKTKGIRTQLALTTGLRQFPLLHKGIQVAITFSLVCFAWIFFRASSLGDAFYILTHLSSGFADCFVHCLDYGYLKAYITMGHGGTQLLLAIIFLTIMEILEFFQRKGSVRDRLARLHPVVQWAICIGLVLVIVNMGVIEEIPFIYFQF